MARTSKPKPSHTVASAMALLNRELARLASMDAGETVPTILDLERSRLADENRARRVAETDAADLRRENAAIVADRDRLARELQRERERPATQTIELRDLAEARQTIVNLRADLARERGESVASTLGSIAGDHDALCWRALLDALRCMPGAIGTEGTGDKAGEAAQLDHPLGEIACAMLRAGADDLGCVHASQVVASELHGLARDAAAWRRLRDALAGDMQANESDRDSIAEKAWRALERMETAHHRADLDRTTLRMGNPERRKLAPWAAWDASALGIDLADAVIEGIGAAQTTSDDDARVRDHLEGEAQDKPKPRDDHAVWWRTFVAAACGSSSEDGDARRLAWAMRRARLPVTSCDNTIETAEACGLVLCEIMDRGASHVA